MLMDTSRWIRGLLALGAMVVWVACADSASDDTSSEAADAADSSSQTSDDSSGDGTSSDDQATTDDATGTDTDSTDTTDETSTDTGDDTSDSSDDGTDSTDSTDPTDTPDEVEPAIDSFADRPLGQCVEDIDCKAQNDLMYCNRAHPGGVCLGCGTDDQCPGDTICYVGSCVQECSELSDCPPGLYCTGAGRCGASWCVDNACTDALYGCGETGRCARAACSGVADCPAETSCTDGLCIEDRELGLSN